MNNLSKSFFIFAAGLGLGMVFFSGTNSSHTTSLQTSYDNAYNQEFKNELKNRPRPSLAFQKSALAPNSLALSKNKAGQISLENLKKFKAATYSQEGVYAAAPKVATLNGQQQKPIAPPSQYPKAELPNPEMAAEAKDPKDESLKQANNPSPSKEAAALREELLAKKQEIENLKSNKKFFTDNEGGTASFASSVGPIENYSEEDDNDSNSSVALVGGSSSTTGSTKTDMSSSELLQTFSTEGVNAANTYLAADSLSMAEYVEYMSMGLESGNATYQQLAIASLSQQLDATAFATLAQFYVSSSSQMAQLVDSALASNMKTAAGLKFLSTQIANTSSSLASQLAIQTISSILQTQELTQEAVTVLNSQVLNSLNKLATDHPSYSQGQQLAALIPNIVNS